MRKAALQASDVLLPRHNMTLTCYGLGDRFGDRLGLWFGSWLRDRLGDWLGGGFWRPAAAGRQAGGQTSRVVRVWAPAFDPCRI